MLDAMLDVALGDALGDALGSVLGAALGVAVGDVHGTVVGTVFGTSVGVLVDGLVLSTAGLSSVFSRRMSTYLTLGVSQWTYLNLSLLPLARNREVSGRSSEHRFHVSPFIIFEQSIS